MKTSDFEATFTAWIDGKLAADETAAFESELRARGLDPAAERLVAGKTSALLAQHSSVPPLPHPDFFQHHLMRRIERERQETSDTGAKQARVPWWTFPRLIWAGAFSLLIAGVLARSLIPTATPSPASNYFATIVDARTFESEISVNTVYDPRDNVTVLWLNGLDDMSDDIVVQ